MFEGGRDLGINLKRPLVIEEVPTKERGSRTMVGNMIKLGCPVLSAPNLLLGHRWRLSSPSTCSSRAHLMETPDTNLHHQLRVSHGRISS